jgi:predicted nuclease with TOPRIM domain
MNGLKQLFETHYIQVPEDRVDVLDNLYNENQELEAKLNEQIEANLELNKVLTMLEAREIFTSVSSDMTQVDAEKFAALAENVEFNNAEEFANKLTILKENFLQAPVAVEEGVTTGSPETLLEDSAMSVYVNALSRHTKK